MNSNRSLKVNELTQLLSRLDQTATASLFDFVEDTRFWIKDAMGATCE